MSHVSLFVSPELRGAIERSAAENDRSLSAEIRTALSAHVSRPSGATPSLPSGVTRQPGGATREHRPVNAAARAAETAADDAVRVAGFAIGAAKEAERHAQAIDKVAPDPQKAIVRELASHEQSALLSIGPRRHRWRELQRFAEQLAEIEQRREQLLREIGRRGQPSTTSR